MLLGNYLNKKKWNKLKIFFVVLTLKNQIKVHKVFQELTVT